MHSDVAWLTGPPDGGAQGLSKGRLEHFTAPKSGPNGTPEEKTKKIPQVL